MIDKWAQVLDVGEVPSEWHGDNAPVYAAQVPAQPTKTLLVKAFEGIKLLITNKERR